MALSTNSNLRRLRSSPRSDESASRLIAIAVPIPIPAPGECGRRLGAMLDGAVVEIVVNANDGGWILAHFLEHEKEPALVGTEDWVFFGDVREEMGSQR